MQVRADCAGCRGGVLKVNALIVSVVVFLTIVLCLAFGVLCGYAAVCGVLHALGHKPQKPESTAALTAAHVSGD